MKLKTFGCVRIKNRLTQPFLVKFHLTHSKPKQKRCQIAKRIYERDGKRIDCPAEKLKFDLDQLKCFGRPQ